MPRRNQNARPIRTGGVPRGAVNVDELLEQNRKRERESENLRHKISVWLGSNVIEQVARH